MIPRQSSGETKGAYLLLAKRIKGGFLDGDEGRLKGIIFFFNYILFSLDYENLDFANFLKDDTQIEKNFKSFSTKDYLGPGLGNITVIVSEKDKPLFTLEKTECSLKIIKEQEIKNNFSITEDIFGKICQYLNKNCLVDSKQGSIMLLDKVESIHAKSIEIIINKSKMFYISI